MKSVRHEAAHFFEHITVTTKLTKVQLPPMESPHSTQCCLMAGPSIQHTGKHLGWGSMFVHTPVCAEVGMRCSQTCSALGKPFTGLCGLHWRSTRLHRRTHRPAA